MDLEKLAGRYANEFKTTRAELMQAALELRMQQAYITAARKKCLTEALINFLKFERDQYGLPIDAIIAKKLLKKIKNTSLTGTIAREQFPGDKLPAGKTAISEEQIAAVLRNMQQISRVFDTHIED